MEWVSYTYAEAVRRITETLRSNRLLEDEQKVQHLRDLLCTMAKRLPREWNAEVQNLAAADHDCDPDVLLAALDRDLAAVHYQPDRYAAFGALRQLTLAIKDLERSAESSAKSASTAAGVVRTHHPPL